MDSMIGRTLPEAGLDTIFKEVDHHETLGTRYPEQLRLFHLQVSNNKFIFTSLENYLTGIISEYVFSRAQMERLTDPKSSINPRSIGIKALRVMKKNGAADQKGTGNELGEILLYAFLEDVLGAPKLFSKVELNAASTPFGKEAKKPHSIILKQRFIQRTKVLVIINVDKDGITELYSVSAHSYRLAHISRSSMTCFLSTSASLKGTI